MDLHTLFTLILYTSASLQENKGFNLKKTLLTLSAIALLATPSLFAHENSLQDHLRIGQMLQKQEQKRLKNANGAMNQYKYQHQHQYQPETELVPKHKRSRDIDKLIEIRPEEEDDKNRNCSRNEIKKKRFG